MLRLPCLWKMDLFFLWLLCFFLQPTFIFTTWGKTESGGDFLGYLCWLALVFQRPSWIRNLESGPEQACLFHLSHLICGLNIPENDVHVLLR